MEQTDKRRHSCTSRESAPSSPPEIQIAGIRMDTERNRRCTSKPDRPGILTSRTMQSGCLASSDARKSSPEEKKSDVVVSQPQRAGLDPGALAPRHRRQQHAQRYSLIRRRYRIAAAGGTSLRFSALRSGSGPIFGLVDKAASGNYPHESSPIPSCAAIRMSSAAERACIRSMMRARWNLTVCSTTPRPAAICLFNLPAAIASEYLALAHCQPGKSLPEFGRIRPQTPRQHRLVHGHTYGTAQGFRIRRLGQEVRSAGPHRLYGHRNITVPR